MRPVTAEQVMAPSHRAQTDEKLYLYSMGKRLRVTAIFTSADTANSYMENHRDEGVIAELGPFIFLANLYDSGNGVQS